MAPTQQLLVRVPLEYVRIHVYYNPHMDTRTLTQVSVSAA